MMAGAVKLEAPWGTRVLVFDLTRESRNRLQIVVQPDGGIRVFAPERATDEEVVERVQRRGDWVARQLEQFESWRPRTPARQYVSGESHLFLGRQLRLRVIEGADNSLAVSGDRIVVSVPVGAGRELVRERVLAWYTAQAKKVLRQQYEAQVGRWLRHGIEPPQLMIRALRSRWGSLTGSGNLILNRDLIRASPRLIDYVIAHELAHVAHPDHGHQWKTLLSRVMPDWRMRKEELERQLL